MILPLHDALRTAIAAALQETYGLDAAGLPPLVVEYPPRRAMGDLAFPVAFELARRLKKAPRAIAAEVVGRLQTPGTVDRVEAAPNGYINVFLHRTRFLRDELARTARPVLSPDAAAGDGKVVVEHTAINPNKAAHVGHLRNAALGDTLVRLLRFQGHPVEVQNYIDDTGVQVADVVVGFTELESKTVDEVRALAEAERFDYYCWDLYARVTAWYEEDRTRLRHRTETLHELEQGGTARADLAAFVADRIVRRHLETMGRLDVDYDLLTWEGDILRLHFWATAFERLKQQGSVFLQNQGRLAGCWVMRIDEDAGGSEPEAASGEGEPAEGDEEPREKVIVRSDGTVTYVGKDMAYQFWKFGLLGRDFFYRPFGRRLHEGVLWATSASPIADPAMPTPPRFGGASAVYNVIDVRQSYLQKLLKQALAAAGHPREAERSTHYAYEMVALSPATARELGYDVDSDGRSFVEVSGRKGLGVKADDLLDRLVTSALAEVKSRNEALADEDATPIAEAIATAAIRYFLVKFARTKVIAFDIAEALSFEGETGPYLQYASVRANNIFAKLHEREGVTESDVVATLETTPAAALEPGPEGDDLWGLVLEAARLDEIVDQSIRTLELSTLAKYAFGLAQTFNALYHRYPILNEERPDVRRWRAGVVAYFRRQMIRTLDLMGCPVPPRM